MKTFSAQVFLHCSSDRKLSEFMIHMESLPGAMHCAESWGNKDKIKTLSLRNSEPKERQSVNK